MGGIFVIVLVVAIGCIGASIWGLFNRSNPIICGLAGCLLMLVSPFGAMHAWSEGQSLPWTVAYLAIACLGIITVTRQIVAKNDSGGTS